MTDSFLMSKATALRDWALANWPIKLTALVLAMVLWAVVAAEETTTQLVPVRLDVRPPEGRTLAGDLPPVHARYGGKLRDLLKLYENPPVIQKAIPGNAGASYGLDLSVQDLIELENVDVVALEVQPATVTVTLDDIFQRTVRVNPRVTIVPDSGFAVFGDIGVSPATVTVRGPDALVRRIQSVQTVPVERTGSREPLRITVELDTAELGVVQIDPKQVIVSANVGAVTEHVLIGVAVTVEPEAAAWESEPPVVLVTVRGPATRVVRFTRDSVRVVARPARGQAEQVVRLTVVAPPGISGEATPDTALVRRRGRG